MIFRSAPINGHAGYTRCGAPGSWAEANFSNRYHQFRMRVTAV